MSRISRNAFKGDLFIFFNRDLFIFFKGDLFIFFNGGVLHKVDWDSATCKCAAQEMQMLCFLMLQLHSELHIV